MCKKKSHALGDLNDTVHVYVQVLDVIILLIKLVVLNVISCLNFSKK